MPLHLTEVEAANVPLVERLLQLYWHDLSEFSSEEPQADAAFASGGAKPWEDPDRHCHMVTLRGKPAGLLFTAESSDGGGHAVHQLTDVFILRCYRGLGLGEEAVLMAVRPLAGPWTAKVQNDNTPGLAFFRRILRRNAGRNYRELSSPCGSMRVFEFSSDGSSIVRG
jgi:predicted acetyltransferase